MSGGHHTPSHGHGGDHGGLWLGTAKSWFATKSPSKLNPLSATDAVAYNVVDGVVVNATNATADILDAGATAAMNLGSLVSPDAYRKHGAMNIVKIGIRSRESCSYDCSKLTLNDSHEELMPYGPRLSPITS
jgi:hypothetical protein